MELQVRKFAGIQNTLPAERLNSGFIHPSIPGQQEVPADLVDAVNVDIDDSNQIASRKGQVLKIAGNFTAVWSDGSIALAVRDGTLLRIWSDYSTQVVAEGVGPELRALRLGNRVYWSDRETRCGLIESSGHVRSWGLPIPSGPNLASGSGGSFAAGRYRVAISTRRLNGLESGICLSQVIDIADNNSLTMTWNIDEPDAIEVVVYLSEPNGATLYRAASALTVQGSLTLTGAELYEPANNLLLDKAMPFAELTAYNGRLYGSQDEFLYASELHSFELFNTLNYRSVDGTRIQMLAAVDSGLFIGTDLGVSIAQGASLSDLSISQVRESAVIPGTMIYADGDKVTGRSELAGRQVVIFATQKGVLVGLPDGDLINLTYARYRFNPGSQGAAVFRDTEELHQYLLFTR